MLMDESEQRCPFASNQTVLIRKETSLPLSRDMIFDTLFAKRMQAGQAFGFFERFLKADQTVVGLT
jgi:hypothetical protein